MHPHQCVSYASICRGVAQVEVKTQTNGTQYVCHPRYQPFGVGTPTKDTFSVHCGYENYNLLLMELLEDGHYKYSCLNGFFASLLMRCLIAVYMQEKYSCLFCKIPFKGYQCIDVRESYDSYETNPPKICDYRCTQCSSDGFCYICRMGFVKKYSDSKDCEVDCQGSRSCSMNTGQLVVGSDCAFKYYWDNNLRKCLPFFYYCATGYAAKDWPQETCETCFNGYYRGLIRLSSSVYFCFGIDWNCHNHYKLIECFNHKLCNPQQIIMAILYIKQFANNVFQEECKNKIGIRAYMLEILNVIVLSQIFKKLIAQPVGHHCITTRWHMLKDVV